MAGTEQKRRKLDFSEEVTVVVGTTQKKFTIPKCLLTQTSDFFKACCRGTWTEATSKAITLPEVEPTTFSVYLQWLYTGTVVVLDEDEEATTDLSSDDDGNCAAHLHYQPLFEAAILADRLQDFNFSNAVTDCIIDCQKHFSTAPGASYVEAIYTTLPQSSPLRKLVVHMYNACPSIGKFLLQHKELYQKDFFLDMFIGAKSGGQSRNIALGRTPEDRCMYHVHDEKVPKCV